MGLKPTEIIKEQMDAVTVTAGFELVQKMLPATLFATNLAGSEEVDIFFSVDEGTTFEELAQDGANLVLTATANVFNIQSPMFLGVKKDATAAAGGVFIMTTNPAK